MSEWRTVRVGDVAEVYDGPHATPKKTQDGPWYLSISSLDRGSINLSASAHISQEDFERWTRRVRVESGDTLFSYETRLGSAGHWDLCAPAALGRRMGILRPRRHEVDPRFLTYAFLGPDFQEQIVRRANYGATVDRIPISELPSWEIAVPPLDEQRRIAGMLGALDDLAEECHRLASLCVELSDSSWYVAQEGTSRFVELGTLATPSKQRLASDAPQVTRFVGLEHFAQNGGGLTGAGVISDVSSGAISFSRGNVLYGKLRPYFRKYARPGFDGACSPEIWVLKPMDLASQSLLHAVVASVEFTTHAMAGAGGTRMPRASWAHSATFQVAVPDPTKAEILEIATSELWEAHWQLRDEADQARSTRDELLPLLMSGQVRVGEVEDAGVV